MKLTIRVFLNSEKIEKVRKENMFGEEVTESEMDIIQKRVALQQRQFQEFEKREYKRKSKKIKGVYDHLTDEEISDMLVDCGHDEVGNVNTVETHHSLLYIGRSHRSSYPA
jgi:hypothetical protein